MNVGIRAHPARSDPALNECRVTQANTYEVVLNFWESTDQCLEEDTGIACHSKKKNVRRENRN